METRALFTRRCESVVYLTLRERCLLDAARALFTRSCESAVYLEKLSRLLTACVHEPLER